MDIENTTYVKKPLRVELSETFLKAAAATAGVICTITFYAYIGRSNEVASSEKSTKTKK